ncbi:hypothetical protein [Actinomadura madurae]|uniref:hypothetical protein n=1 Tax=Actinomadura madurae TaxID=1993 RepID=UPI0020D215BE|nr:hypothetical protein [Actinomadura madurae]MCP9978527.1 hypothetical protein [Actinomadura madurae]
MTGGDSEVFSEPVSGDRAAGVLLVGEGRHTGAGHQVRRDGFGRIVSQGVMVGFQSGQVRCGRRGVGPRGVLDVENGCWLCRCGARQHQL